jgi:hypothetical protein
MSVVHISEEEALKNFRVVLSHVDEGAEVIIDRAGGHLALVSSGPAQPFTAKEAIEVLRKRNNAPTGDDTFADDIEFAMERMRAPSNRPSPWD